MSRGLVVLVTGGSGFVGAQICRLLADKDCCEVPIEEIRVIDLVPPKGSAFKAWNDKAVSSAPPPLKFINGSICDDKCLTQAFQDGVDVVIHSASLVDFGNKPPELIMNVNVTGTEKILKFCKNTNVRCLIYTSSLDTISPFGPNVNCLSDTPYPKTIDEFSSGTYGYSKSLAEKLVLQANNTTGADGNTKLYTCSLRPRGIYGPGDPYYMVNIIWARTSGLMSAKIGDGTVRSDHIFNGNVAYAHICALHALCGEDTQKRNLVAGRPFNLSHEKPCSVYERAAPFLEVFKATVPTASLPAKPLFHLAHLLEILVSVIPRSVRPQLVFTRTGVDSISNEKTYGDPQARKDLGFDPPYFSEEQALCETIQWLREEWPDRPTNKSKSPSSTTFYVANILFLIIAVVIFQLYFA